MPNDARELEEALDPRNLMAEDLLDDFILSEGEDHEAIRAEIIRRCGGPEKTGRRGRRPNRMIESEMAECPRHGVTEHRYYRRSGGGVRATCMACNREAVKACLQRKREQSRV